MSGDYDCHEFRLSTALFFCLFADQVFCPQGTPPVKSHMVKNGQKNQAVVSPPPFFGQCPKENIFFYRSPSLSVKGIHEVATTQGAESIANVISNHQSNKPTASDIRHQQPINKSLHGESNVIIFFSIFLVKGLFFSVILPFCGCTLQRAVQRQLKEAQDREGTLSGIISHP